MKSLFKWIGIILAIIIVIIGITVSVILIATPNFIDTPAFKAPVQLYLAKVTGRQVSMDEDMKLRLFPWAELSLSNLQVGKKKGVDNKKFLSLHAEEVHLKLLPSLSPRGIIEIIEQLNAVQQPGDTDHAASSGKKDMQDMAAFLIEDITVTNGVVSINDKKNDTCRTISDVDLKLYDVSFERPIGISLTAKLGDIPFLIKGNIGPISEQPGSEPIAVNLVITVIDEVKIHVNGTVENALDDPFADIAIEIAEFSPRVLAKEMIQTLAVADTSSVLKRLSLKAHIKGGSDSIVISDGILILDDYTMNFTSKARNIDKPNIDFELSLDRINLDRYLPANNEDAKTKLTQTFLQTPPEQNYYALLKNMVLDGTVSIGELIVNDEKIDDTSFHITSRKGLLKVDPRLN